MPALRCILLTGLLLAGVAAEPGVRAQPAAQDSAAASYGSGIGLKVVLTNSGFGLGGYLSRAAGRSSSFVTELHVASGKDAREAAFFDRFGRRDIPEKASYLLVVPLRLGLQQRLLRRYIEDNFRPYLHVSVGPTVGWAYPYFDDENDNEELDEGERVYGTFAAFPQGDLHVGFGAAVAIGAHFGSSRTAARGVRVGYAFDYFPEAVQLLEPGVKGPQRYFGTPTISLTFGRLF